MNILDMESFLMACSFAEDRAKEVFRVMYVMDEGDGVYTISWDWEKDWLFKVYPGGRRELSRKGNELRKSLGIDI